MSCEEGTDGLRKYTLTISSWVTSKNIFPPTLTVKQKSSQLTNLQIRLSIAKKRIMKVSLRERPLRRHIYFLTRDAGELGGHDLPRARLLPPRLRHRRQLPPAQDGGVAGGPVPPDLAAGVRRPPPPAEIRFKCGRRHFCRQKKERIMMDPLLCPLNFAQWFHSPIVRRVLSSLSPTLLTFILAGDRKRLRSIASWLRVAEARPRPPASAPATCICSVIAVARARIHDISEQDLKTEDRLCESADRNVRICGCHV